MHRAGARAQGHAQGLRETVRSCPVCSVREKITERDAPVKTSPGVVGMPCVQQAPRQ